jgi:hypothetical protein
MRGRAVGIDKTMKRLKNKTCGDCPLVNSAGPAVNIPITDLQFYSKRGMSTT